MLAQLYFKKKKKKKKKKKIKLRLQVSQKMHEVLLTVRQNIKNLRERVFIIKRARCLG